MKKQKNFQLVTISVLVFAVLFMAIGFAAYAQTLKINGTVNVAKSKWSVHFVENQYQEEANSVAATNHSVGETNFSFTADLAAPGDYYAANIKVINDGTFNAILDSINMSTLSAEQAKYLTYTVEYGGTPFSASASGLNTALAVGQTVDVLVRVDYVQPDDAADLPQENINVNLSADLNYSQAN